MNGAVVVTPVNSRDDAWRCHDEDESEWLESKLLSGETLTVADWETLEMSKKQSPVFQPEHQQSHRSEPPQRPPPQGRQQPMTMIRWIGMVQDMLETEYVSSKNTAMPTGMNQHIKNNILQLIEQSPVVLVNVPAASPWWNRQPNLNQARDEFTKAADFRKRGVEEEEKHRDKRLKLQSESWRSSTTAMNEDCKVESASSSTSSSSSTHIVAKLYYEQYPSSRAASKLQLNQIVEILGVLEKPTPIEEDDQNNSAALLQVVDSKIQCSDWEGSMWEDADHRCENGDRILPSNVPCIHVLWFRTVHLDDVIENDFLDTETPVPLPGHIYSRPTTDPAQILARALGLHSSHNNNDNVPVAACAQALWMLLQSKAERRDGQVIVTPQDTVLGCASLNLVVPEHFSTDRLLQTLQQLAPVVQVVTIRGDDDDPLMAGAPRQSVGGRLPLTPWQLPAGAVLVLDVRQAPPHGRTNVWSACVPLCHSHRLHYTFAGNMRLPFEADYRVIVLSSLQTRHLLPCTLTVHDRFETDSTGHDDDPSTTVSALVALREHLQQQCRARPTIAIDPAVLEQAQRDFLQRRPVVGEADLHRWLTLCRLHARSRHAAVANLTDWQCALVWDDAMQATTHD